MSTTLTKGGSASAQPPVSKAVVSPVPILDNPVAAAVSLVHPVLLSGLFAWRFGALVADPASTLQTALPVVVAVQVVYAVLCLPIAGSQNGKTSRKTRPGEKKKSSSSDSSAPNPVVTAVLSLLLTAIAAPGLYVLFVLFGAPFLTHVEHTFLCCAHLAVLAVFPVFYVRGIDAQLLSAVLGATAPLDETFGGFAGAVAGAWLGAVPIPLDWDREWQKWPVTIVVGVYLGYIIGGKLLGRALYGTQWASSEETYKEE